MKWEFDNSRPLGVQLYEQICVRISGGEYEPGARLLSVGDMAVQTGLSPNTVRRTYEKLEQQSILDLIPDSGWHVAGDIMGAQEVVERMFYDKTRTYFDTMEALGVSYEDTRGYVQRWRL